MVARRYSFLAMTVAAVAAAALFWLLRDHWRHAAGYVGYLPYLLFLACPLMHLVMHHGHGEQGHDHGSAPRDRAPPTR
ncbi:DUF2933 domain-containing protein [Phenylobacterium sp. 20VBR1]|uniref:DUF2933 domain-containing protein n=1 Tax=Phenylobacterium glaciei TaxID=2803784 RepID=A0A941CZK2_9CAUL|nr:DUF2933 domain-containing protein [Phenylobacterium glaciei]MBR7618749.1 DUF2933 domain-containing protein [Phenylobacterium glaciei]